MGKQAQKYGFQWESIFQKSFKSSFEDGFIYKILDTNALEGAKKAASKTSGSSVWNKIIVPKTPSDFICIANGRTLFVECKNTVNKTSFPLANIKESQFQFALEIENAGGKYLFAIRRHEPRKHECFLLTVNDIIRLKIANGDRKSIRWEQLRDDEFVKRPPLLKGSKFGLGMLFD